MNQTNANSDIAKNRSRGWSDDMSSDAIARRLCIVGELYELWQSLKKAKPLEAVITNTAGEGSTFRQVKS